MLAAEDEFLGQLDGASVRAEALQVVGGGAGDALQDLHGVPRDAAAAAVVQGAPEASLVLVVGVDVDVLVGLEAVEMVVFLA